MKRATRRKIQRILMNLLGMFYVLAGVATTVLITFVGSILGKLLVLGVGLLLGAVGYYVHSIRGRRRRTKTQLRPLIEEFFLPNVVRKYQRVYPDADPPPVRTNVMLLEYRDFPPSVRGAEATPVEAVADGRFQLR